MILGPGQLPANPAWREGSPGSLSAPFASVAELLASVSSAPLRTVVWFANPCVPWLASRLWRVGSVGTIADWVPPPFEVIAKESGVPLFNQNGGFAAGSVNQLFRGPIIPDVFIPNQGAFLFEASIRLTDTVSTANWLTGCGITGEDYVGSDANDSMIGRLSGAATSYTLGVSPFVRRIWRDGVVMRGSAGATVANADTYRHVGSFVSGAMRFRSWVNPGATTNNVSIDRYSLTAL